MLSEGLEAPGKKQCTDSLVFAPFREPRSTHQESSSTTVSEGLNVKLPLNYPPNT